MTEPILKAINAGKIYPGGMAIIGVAGFLSDYVVLLLGRHLLAWSPQHG